MSQPATALRRNQASPAALPAPDPIDVARFEATMTAWFATALEITKSIFTLASAGFGLTVNLQFGDKALAHWPAVWFLLASFMFGCSAVVCILIFANNKEMARESMNGNSLDELEPIAVCRDWASRITFVGGLVFSFFAVVAAIYLSEPGAK